MGIQSLTDDEVRALLTAAKAHRTRDWLMCLVAFAHGLRETEVVGGWLKRKDKTGIKRVWYPGLTPENFSSNHITVQRLKGSLKTRQTLLDHPDPLLNEKTGLFEYMRGMSANQRLFPVCRQTFWRIVQRHGRAAGIDKELCHPHILKHSIAMYLHDKIEVNELQQHLGHKNGANTLEYLKTTDEKASAAVQRALVPSRSV